MSRRLFIVLFYLFLCSASFAQPREEVRAVWLTTVYSLDWPKAKANSQAGIKKQKEELCTILDKLQAANFNTVLFQTRLRGDVIYPSSIEPYSRVLTGQNGKSPSYDPLAFAIEECHKRGLELHAWIVSIPVGTQKHIKGLGKTSITSKRPSICKQYQGEWYLDPGQPETKEYLFSIVNEITTRYDVDGIHLDYIRYPDRPQKFPDSDSFRKYGKGKTLDNWRRENITTIVRRIYKGVKEQKPWVKVSSSPIGKFKDTSRYSSFGWNAYNTVYQDAQGWLREGIHDMLFPMMYFDGNHFYPFILDWQEKSFGRQIIPGLGIYFMHHTEKKDWPCELIERQLNFIRQQQLTGQAYYRAQHLVEDTKGIYTKLNSIYYPYPAHIPAMKWMNNTSSPTTPGKLTIREENEKIYLSWETSTCMDMRTKPSYTIYASDSYPVDITDPANILRIGIKENKYTHSAIYSSEKKKYFAVTATDRYGNESEAAQLEINNINPIRHITDNILYLPPLPYATAITITDITGRSIMNASYNDHYLLLDKLKQGHYRILITEESGKTSRLGDIFLQ